MPQYLDIGVVRIQRYLGRWPSLAGRRNASALLSETMRPDAISRVLAGRAAANSEAGDVDGVMSLCVADGHDPATVADDALIELRRRLPTAEFEAVWSRSDDYVSAYPQMRRHAREGGGLVSIPTSHGFPLLKVCDLCRVDAAVTSVRRPDGSVMACADCSARAGHRHGSRAERLLSDATGWAMAEDFESLAHLGAEGTKGNHLALIAADGNSFGAFFSALAKSGIDRDPVVAAFKDATRNALVGAAEELGEVDGVCRVLPHVMGGDDVLVSVPATYGWSFVRSYLTWFNSRIESTVRAHSDSLPVPTASAAVVIAHQSWPFARAAELAEALLRNAKRAGAGRLSTVAWQEVTRRGDDPDAAFSPLPLSTVDEWAPHLGRLQQHVARSSRYRLETLLAEGASYGELRELGRRLGLIRRNDDVDLLFPDVVDWDLASALDISRWFR